MAENRDYEEWLAEETRRRRDLFAAAALQGMLAGKGGGMHMVDIKDAWKIADAMLETDK